MNIHNQPAVNADSILVIDDISQSHPADPPSCDDFWGKIFLRLDPYMSRVFFVKIALCFCILIKLGRMTTIPNRYHQDIQLFNLKIADNPIGPTVDLPLSSIAITFLATGELFKMFFLSGDYVRPWDQRARDYLSSCVPKQPPPPQKKPIPIRPPNHPPPSLSVDAGPPPVTSPLQSTLTFEVTSHFLPSWSSRRSSVAPLLDTTLQQVVVDEQSKNSQKSNLLLLTVDKCSDIEIKSSQQEVAPASPPPPNLSSAPVIPPSPSPIQVESTPLHKGRSTLRPHRASDQPHSWLSTICNNSALYTSCMDLKMSSYPSVESCNPHSYHSRLQTGFFPPYYLGRQRRGRPPHPKSRQSSHRSYSPSWAPPTWIASPSHRSVSVTPHTIMPPPLSSYVAQLSLPPIAHLPPLRPLAPLAYAQSKVEIEIRSKPISSSPSPSDPLLVIDAQKAKIYITPQQGHHLPLPAPTPDTQHAGDHTRRQQSRSSNTEIPYAAFDQALAVIQSNSVN